MSLGLARGRPLIPLGNPARDARRPKCWKSPVLWRKRQIRNVLVSVRRRHLLSRRLAGRAFAAPS
jgi:hypothetical protein